MFKSTTLLQTSETEKQSIFKQHNINEQQFEDHVNHLCDWINKTTLPKEENCRCKFRVFLLNCKLSLEKTKRAVEAYYKLRAVYSFIYDRLVPNTDDYKNVKKFMKTIVMPKLTPDLCRITISTVSDPNGEAMDAIAYLILGLMEAEIRLMDSDYFLSNVIIVNLEEFQFKNVMKFTPSVSQKLIALESTISLRVKNIHFVNPPLVMGSCMTIIKTVTPAKFLSKICLHKNYESLHEYVPKEYLPLNFNGTQSTIDEIYGKWCEEIEHREEDFKRLLLLQTKAKEYTKMATDEREIFGTGFDGSFKKLNID